MILRALIADWRTGAMICGPFPFLFTFVWIVTP